MPTRGLCSELALLGPEGVAQRHRMHCGIIKIPAPFNQDFRHSREIFWGWQSKIWQKTLQSSCASGAGFLPGPDNQNLAHLSVPLNLDKFVKYLGQIYTAAPDMVSSFFKKFGAMFKFCIMQFPFKLYAGKYK
jgi:hypothetical protein